MGLFDKILGKEEKFTELEGFAGIALSAIASDGVITEEEVIGLISTLSRMKLYKYKNQKEIEDMMRKVLDAYRKNGNDALMQQSANTIPKELKETAFAVAVDLLLADGIIEESEKKYLEELQKKLEISDDKALKIVEVIQIKNKG